jgi:transposase
VFALGPATKVYVATGATDMRNGFEGLFGLVRDEMLANPLSGHLFLFSNRTRTRLKLLFWDASGLTRFQISQTPPKRGGALLLG